EIAPGLGLAMSYGDQWQGGGSTLGIISSLNYANRINYTPNRLYNLYYFGQEGTATVEWGGVGNASLRLGNDHKFGWKNLYTRSADETTRSARGSEGIVLQQFYQVRYVERYLWQTQLTGEHRFPFLARSTLSWKGTFGRARINDPDNHSA